MASMLDEYLDTYLVDAVDLRGFTTHLETAEGLQASPAPIGDDVSLSGLDGQLPVFGQAGQPRRPDGPGRITFNMSLLGVDPVTGAFTGEEASAQHYFATWDRLVRLFHRRRLTIDHPRPDGTVRRAVGHLIEGLEPSREPSSPWFGRLRATIAIPSAHWTDINPVTTGPVSLTTGGTLSLEVFAAATAPCTEVVVTFSSGSNPRLTLPYGHLAWNGVISAGRKVAVDTATGLTSQGTGSAWTPGYAGLDYSPGPRLFEVDPSEPLAAILTHTGGGSMAVEVAGRRRYRTS